MQVGKILIAALALSAAGGAAAQPPAPFNRQAWLDDYGAIKQQLARYYANLDSRLAALRVNPARLDKQMIARLEAAHSDLQAYDSLRDLIELFDDKHLKFEFEAPIAASSSSADAEAVTVGDCAAGGYKDGAAEFAPLVTDLAGWRSIGSGPFPHGVAGNIGIVRVPSFFEGHYGAVCRRVFRAGLSEDDLKLTTRAALLGDLADAIAALKAAGAKSLVIDLTGNGGGTEWDVDAAALFTAKTLRRSEPKIADAPCDRSGLWAGRRDCEVFVGQAEMTTVQGKGNWTGPLVLLADWRTASASEEFIGWLVDNKAARLIGETTMGAGCGYVDGAHPLRLKAAPVTLLIPNCARFSARGVNEIEGCTPDVAIPAEQWNSAGLAAAIAKATG